MSVNTRPTQVVPSIAPGQRAWWMQEALAQESTLTLAPPICGSTDADVAIVGGGYTGLWTALELHARDPHARITVLEADICGAGASGKNGGFVHGYWTGLARLVATIGDANALDVARAGSLAQAAIREFCTGPGVDVWWREAGILKVSATPAYDPKFEQAIETFKRLGVPEQAVPLTPSEVQARCASPAFRSGILYPEGATVHPGRLIRALRRAVLNAGIRIYERTPMSRLELGHPNTIVTPHGRVRVEEVVLATNAALTGRMTIGRHVTNFSSFIVLTEPVPELLREIGWTGGEAIADARMFLHYFRTTPDGRVAMGSGSGPIGFAGWLDGRLTGDRGALARAERGLRRLLPRLAGTRITHAWGGPIDVAADHMPFFGTLPGTRVHYGCGYSGHGVNPTWIGGQILTLLVLNQQDRWTHLAFCSRKVPNLPPEPFRFLGGSVIRAAILACEDAEDVGHRPPMLASAVARVPKLLGLRIGIR